MCGVCARVRGRAQDTGKATNAELLSCYLDRVLRAGGEKVAEDKLEQELEGIVSLFVYLSDKVRPPAARCGRVGRTGS